MHLLPRLLRPPFPVVSGDGVLLRVPEPRDYEPWRRLREESRAFLTPWEPLWTSDELSRGSFRARLARYRNEARERTSYTFFLFEPGPPQRLVGGITAGLIRRGVAQSCTIGYWMGERHAGRGHMRAALEALKPFLFEVEGLHRIEAACLPRNERSIRLLETSGFRREGTLQKYLKIAGTWEDHHLYALLAEDFARSGVAGGSMRGRAARGGPVGERDGASLVSRAAR